MSGNDADFAGYLTARWPALVRTVVLIGCPRSDAEAVVETGLAHCYLAWDRTRHVDDVDVHVYREVLGAWHHHPLQRHPPEQREPIWPAVDERRARRGRGAAARGGGRAGGAGSRAAYGVVLALVADLSGRQVVEVLEPPGGVAPDGRRGCWATTP